MSWLKDRWFVLQFDINWVTCQACKAQYYRPYVERKNKCPNCKINNNLERR